jgi:hypothetical protein
LRADERDDEQASEIATDLLLEAVVGGLPVVSDRCAVHEEEL